MARSTEATDQPEADAPNTGIGADVDPGTRTARRAEHAEAIFTAANRLVLEKGADFTTQELIKEAGVALQTFYRHYGSKDQLLLAVIAEQITGHCQALAEAGRKFDNPVDRLHFYITSTVESVSVADSTASRFITSQHWRLHQEFPGEIAMATRPYTDLITSVLAEGRATGSLTPRDPERDAWLITKIVMGVFHYFAFARDDDTARSAADDVWQFCCAAVGGPAERSNVLG